RSVRGRIYRANGQTAETIQVYYREDTLYPERGRYVLAADELMGTKQQPYVHDSVITIEHRRKKYTFRIFYKHHKLLPINQPIQALGGVAMEGDVLVVACGKKVAVRNFQNSREIRAAENAVRRFVQRLSPFRDRRSFPASLGV
ncbi:hypothetical protein BDP27DRAFT_1230994, partial [Rhodocollybia butyracea]